MTGSRPCPRSAVLYAINPRCCRPRVARDIRLPCRRPGAFAGVRARRPAARPGRCAASGAPDGCGAGRGTPLRTQLGDRARSRQVWTTSGTRCIDAWTSTPASGEAPSIAHSTAPPWITIPPPPAAPSGRAVDHDPAVRWITTRAPLKYAGPRRRSRPRSSGHGMTSISSGPMPGRSPKSGSRRSIASWSGARSTTASRFGLGSGPGGSTTRPWSRGSSTSRRCASRSASQLRRGRSSRDGKPSFAHWARAATS